MYKASAINKHSLDINGGEMTHNMMAYTADYFLSYNDYYNDDTKTFSKNFLRVDGINKDKLRGDVASAENY